MRKRPRISTGVGLLAVLIAVLMLVPASASADRATVTRTGMCGLFGADAEGGPIFGGLGDVILRLETDTRAMLVCRGTGATNLSGETQTFDSLPCSFTTTGGIVNGTTTHAVVTADGDASFTCVHIRP